MIERQADETPNAARTRVLLEAIGQLTAQVKRLADLAEPPRPISIPLSSLEPPLTGDDDPRLTYPWSRNLEGS